MDEDGASAPSSLISTTIQQTILMSDEGLRDIMMRRQKEQKEQRRQSRSGAGCQAGATGGGAASDALVGRQMFRQPAKARFHHAEEGATITSFPDFASSGMCNELISLCEAQGFATEQSKPNDAEGGEDGEDRHMYRQATEDLEVDAHSRVKEWLRSRGLVEAVSGCMMRTHGVSPAAFDDVFVVKYHAGRQAALRRHVDAGDVSFMVALSPRSSYTGGGTVFDVLRDDDLMDNCDLMNESEQLEEKQENKDDDDDDDVDDDDSHGHGGDDGDGDGDDDDGEKVVEGHSRSLGTLHLEQGELVLFDASLFHSGAPITSGARYLLVGFCFAGPGSTRVPGNVGLGLERIRGSRSRFDLWRLEGAGMKPFSSARFLADVIDLFRLQEESGNMSSWIGAAEEAAEGSLAAFAQAVFRFHAPRLGLASSAEAAASGGAEFWVQCVEGPGNSSNSAADDEAESIPWHYDKDEGHMRATGELRHPLVATVTYLTDGGIPTVVFGERETLVSFPRAGNHLAFSGNLLHGCPSTLSRYDLLRASPWPGCCCSCLCSSSKRGHEQPGLHGAAASSPAVSSAAAAASAATRKMAAPSATRVTLLVNLWPFDPPDRSGFLIAGPHQDDIFHSNQQNKRLKKKRKTQQQRSSGGGRDEIPPTTAAADGSITDGRFEAAGDYGRRVTVAGLSAALATWHEVPVERPALLVMDDSSWDPASSGERRQGGSDGAAACDEAEGVQDNQKKDGDGGYCDPDKLLLQVVKGGSSSVMPGHLQDDEKGIKDERLDDDARSTAAAAAACHPPRQVRRQECGINNCCCCGQPQRQGVMPALPSTSSCLSPSPDAFLLVPWRE